MRWTYILLLLTTVLVPKGYAQSGVGRLAFAHLYDPESELNVASHLTKGADSLELTFTLKLNQSKSKLADYQFSLYALNSYTDDLKLQVPLAMDSIFLGRSKQGYQFRVGIAHIPEPLLVLKITSMFSGKVFFFDVPTYTISPIQLSIHSGQAFTADWLTNTSYQADGEYWVKYYDHSFEPGAPPMVVRDEPVQQQLLPASIYTIHDTLIVDRMGLYILQADTSTTEALSLRAEDRYFPKLTTLPQLLEPLIYITTKDESEYLQQVGDDKKKFDRFWLDLAKSPDRAKQLIRHYYSRIEEANSLFTTYKAGWKTDMGMIYTIFGPPDDVMKTLNDETWVYLARRNLPIIKFSFMRIPSVFSHSHYVLVRDKKYSTAWFSTIDLMRRGRFY